MAAFVFVKPIKLRWLPLWLRWQRNLSAMRETWFDLVRRSPGSEMATHSMSATKSHGQREPLLGWLPRSQRVRHEWANWHFLSFTKLKQMLILLVVRDRKLRKPGKKITDFEDEQNFLSEMDTCNSRDWHSEYKDIEGHRESVWRNEVWKVMERRKIRKEEVRTNTGWRTDLLFYQEFYGKIFSSLKYKRDIFCGVTNIWLIHSAQM